MKRPRSRLEGKIVEIFATGFDYPVTGRINRIVQEIKGSSDHDKYCYELETSDGHIYLIDLNEVCWISSKKVKYRHLKVVDIHAQKNNKK